MADAPILFSSAMILAIQAGRKSQTRRLASSPLAKRKAGEILWVRERTRVDCVADGCFSGTYVADNAPTGLIEIPGHLKTLEPGKCLSMGCFKGAHRIELRVVRVWIEPLQAISEVDAIHEGVTLVEESLEDPAEAYAALWNSLHTANGERWEDNPDVVALEFQRTNFT